MSDAGAGAGVGRATRALLAILTGLSVMLAGAATAIPASAAPPLGAYGSTLSFTLAGVDPVVVTATGTNLLTVTGSYTNTGANLVTGLGYKFQRGDALADVAAIRKEAADPRQQIAVINSGFQSLPGSLAGGATARFTATVPITGDPADTLAVTEPGVYPVMININAVVNLPDGPVPARVGELHLMLTVLSVPGDTTGTGSTGGPAGQPRIPFNMLWPIVDTPHLGVDGVFLDDELAAEIAPGGRLTRLVDALGAARDGPSTITLVLDPMLLDELDRMSHGYWVVADPGTAQPPLTPVVPTPAEVTETSPASTGANESAGGAVPPTSGNAGGTDENTDETAPTAPTAPAVTGNPTSPPNTDADADSAAASMTSPVTGTAAPPPGTVRGSGSEAAAAMVERLRALAREYQVLVLPYGDADAVALVRAGMTGDLATAVALGRAVAARVLQQPTGQQAEQGNLVTTVADPIGGVLDADTLAALATLGYRSVVLSADGVTGSASLQGVLPVALGAGSMPAMVSGASPLADIGGFVSSGVAANAPTRVNLIAALLAQQRADGVGTPMLLTPGRDWAPNPAGIGYVTSLVQVMQDCGVVAGTPLTEIADGVAGRPATGEVTYPAAARDAELSARYLASLRQTDDRIGMLRGALSATPGPDSADPADILDPLQQALLPATSAALRGAANPGGARLQTVRATVDALFAGVQIQPADGSYTLASSNSPLLLTLKNTLPYQVSVSLGIVGGSRSGLTAENPGRIEIPAGPRTKQVKIDTKVSRSGTFTVYAQLRGPTGSAWGPLVPIVIDSQAYGVLTLVLMIVAGGVLVLMVAFRIHQRWRVHRARQAGFAIVGDEDKR